MASCCGRRDRDPWSNWLHGAFCVHLPDTLPAPKPWFRVCFWRNLKLDTLLGAPEFSFSVIQTVHLNSLVATDTQLSWGAHFPTASALSLREFCTYFKKNILSLLFLSLSSVSDLHILFGLYQWLFCVFALWGSCASGNHFYFILTQLLEWGARRLALWSICTNPLVALGLIITFLFSYLLKGFRLGELRGI